MDAKLNLVGMMRLFPYEKSRFKQLNGNVGLRCSLGICRRCGDPRMITCSGCKGSGLVKEDGPLSFTLTDDLHSHLVETPR
ncbi:hypothetical protein POTOM_017405 [Populus tomentosa]|uniref:Uncharacterized protein n=1 Tax=Populus tomentosa TaxID=118781 RepID=A0A8X8AAP0_POPTO|nr:hypothetical protein POTOM_017405 [Populus tomentosa]